MRVLWFSVVPLLYEKNFSGSWIDSLRKVVREYAPEIDLGIAFEYKDNKGFKECKDGITYYPIYDKEIRKFRSKLKVQNRWCLLEPLALKIIEDYKPDIIQCFGSEWPFGLVAEKVKIPIVIHMQGFLNIYSSIGRTTSSAMDFLRFYHFNLLSFFRYFYIRRLKSDASNTQEKKIMSRNRYFMGRTDWDRRIVKYYSPNARYFHCEEAIREEIKDCTRRWTFLSRQKMILVTISSASGLKGNNLILNTAKILTEMNFDFEWRVAGNKESFSFYEKKMGIKHSDVGIKLLGYLSAAEIADELCSAEAYVHTSIIDNSPNSLCEAQLMGCPVVSTFVGGIPNLVKNGETGILYPYNEPHTLAFILMDLHNNENILTSLSKQEMEQSHSRHDKAMIATKLQKIYAEIQKDYSR